MKTMAKVTVLSFGTFCGASVPKNIVNNKALRCNFFSPEITTPRDPLATLNRQQ